MNKKPHTCSSCPMSSIGQGFVPGEGPQDAKLVIIGEAPGAEEADNSRPFVGGAGRVLNAALAKAGINRNEVYITNVMKCRPPGNIIPDSFDPGECGRRYLNEELIKINDPVIIVLGDTASTYIFRKVSITRWRGSIIDTPFGKGLLTLHPSYIMRGNNDLFPIFVIDLIKAKEYQKDPTKFQYHENFIINPTIAQVEEFTKKILANQDQDVFLDIENHRSGALICISIDFNGITICIPFLKQRGVAYWNLIEEERAWKCVLYILEANNPKAAHNFNHDVGILEDHYTIINNMNDDTMLMHHTLYCELPHKLEFVSSMYTPIPFWKTSTRESEDEKLGTLDIETDKMQRYNCIDSLVGRICRDEMKKELIDEGLYNFYKHRQIPLAHKIRKMSQRGIPVDKKKMIEGKNYLLSIIDKISLDMSKAAGYAVNINSPDQLAKLLYIDLGFRIIKKTITGKPSTDEKTLRKLMLTADEDQLLILKIIIDHRETATIASRYLDLVIDNEGRCHSKFKIGPVNGRLASDSPNLQNMPRKAVHGVNVKDIFVAPPGYVFVAGDYSQIELRINAHLAQCVRLLTAFFNKEDVHSVNARMLYSLPDDAFIDKDGEQRTFAKTFVYLKGYGGGVDTLIDNALKEGLILSRELAKKYSDRYDNAYPEITAYRNKIVDEALKNKVLYNDFGRKRMFFGDEREIKGQAANNPMSSNAGDLINERFVELENLGINHVLQVHDQLVALEREENAMLIAKKMKEVMERPCILDGREISIPVDFKIGSCLGKMEKIKP